MPVKAGTKLGPYDIVAPLGAGGMGEVWRARDRRLDRSVAVKILPGEFSRNAHLKLRFEREAKTISQLNHPNICTLYDVGHDDGTDFLVMELIEGESLADRLARGPLPVSDVVRYGAEIADALAKAHRHGIVHRDLKPGNVMLTKNGAKLLDFGLARADGAQILTGGSEMATEQKPLTAEGVIVGTFRYMSPEQLEGQAVDHRSDIFALGALLYEMATGRRAFDGKSRTSLIAAIVSSEPPPISQVQPLTPAALERLIRTCLAKDPDARMQSAQDVAIELRWIGEGELEPRGRGRAPWLPWAVAALLAIALAAVLAFRLTRSDPVPAAPLRFTIPAPPDTAFEGIPAISPDGRTIAFATTAVDRPAMLWVRSLDSLETKPVKGTENVTHAFWSPNGRSIGFIARGKLWRLDLDDGNLRALYEPVETLPGGATWSQEDVILFSPNAEGHLHRISASGGKALRVDSGTDVEIWPWFLPDGNRFLYFTSGKERGGIYAGSLSSPERTLLIPIPEVTPSRVAYANGHIVYHRSNELYAQKVNERTLALIGEPTKIEDRMEAYDPGRGAFSVSPAGTLVYHPAGPAIVGQLTIVDRQGNDVSTLGPLMAYGTLRLSPDQRKVAFSRYDTSSAVWTLDIARGVVTRVSFERWAGMPAWTPDSRGIAYAAALDTPPDLFLWHDGSIQRLTNSPLQHYPSDVTPDGKMVIADVYDPGSDMDIHRIMVDPPHTAEPLVKTPFRERGGVVSPDGRWLAYSSNESGRMEIYVKAMAAGGSRTQISTSGGHSARWSPDGRTLYYLESAGEQVMQVAVTALHDELHASVPAPLLAYGGGAYDIMRDGRILLVRQKINPDAAPLTVITNWTAALK